MTGPAKCMPRRKKCAAETRDALLAAARQRFLADSYDVVGLRDVAGDAGVDVALVGRYFGSKEELFKEVLRGSDDSKLDIAVAQDDLSEFLVSLLSQKDGDHEREHMERLLIMLRSASSPTAAQIVREAFKGDVLEPLAAAIGGPGAGRKAALAMAVLVGTSFLKTVLALEPVGDEERALFQTELVQLLRYALSPTEPE